MSTMVDMSVDGAWKKSLIINLKHPQIVVDGFRYYYHTKCKEFLRWRCYRSVSMKCPNVVKTMMDLNNLKIVCIDYDHSHPNDTKTIQQVQNKLASQKEKFREDSSKQIILNISGVFNHQNGKLLPLHTNEKTLARRIHDDSKHITENTNTNKNKNSNIAEFKQFNLQNNSINLTSQNKDDNQTKVTHPCQENVPTSITSQITKSIIETQQTPNTHQLFSENVISNETIPQCLSTLPKSCSKKEMEIAKILSPEGVVSIFLVNSPNPSSTNSNPLYGSLLNEMYSKPHHSTSVSLELQLKKKYGLNNSSITIIPVQKNGLSDVVQRNVIDLTDDDGKLELQLKKKYGLNNSSITIIPVKKNGLPNVVQRTVIDLTDDDNKVDVTHQETHSRWCGNLKYF